MPLEFDPSRSGEPFLRLPSPYQNIIITPPRKSDGPRVLECFSDEKVYKTLISPPQPYLLEHFNSWYKRVSECCARGLQQYHEITSEHNAANNYVTSGRNWADIVPVRSLREVNPVTGEQLYIGDLEIERQRYGGYTSMTEEEQKAARDLNDSYQAGDEKIDWTVGDYLASSHHGHGIMTAALRTMIEQYVVPYLNGHRMTASFFAKNIASRRVFEKNGFVFQGIEPKPIKVLEDGEEIFPGFVLWERNVSSAGDTTSSP
ncbi:hypothetical protein GQ53DRAFT_748517 [Thozetella sp. PMI_491]|nr:hypothetical protein GQ53DRAFT_748517 [Thozetella sp. PMI_491]